MLVCLLAGMILSVTGMAMRWRSHRTSQHRRDREIRTAALNLNENDSH